MFLAAHMKRYRILKEDFDARANLLNLEIKDAWKDAIKQQHRTIKEQINRELSAEFGTWDFDSKLRNFCDLGATPFSVLAYHNRFFRQIRGAFVIGAYYPALTGACALGERILNHLLLALRDSFKGTPEYKAVYRKKSFDSWDIPINSLATWNVLLPDVITNFTILKGLRNDAIHFHPETDRNDRGLALNAVKTLSKIIEGQFGAFGPHPWFIPNIPGESFLRQASESDPFVKTVYLPNCSLVGPFHRLRFESNRWVVLDDFKYEEKEISDDEFAALRVDTGSHPAQ